MSAQIRIAVRYLVGIAFGYLYTKGQADPVVIEGATAVIVGVGTEMWYKYRK